jgi:hypothetical protein
MEFTLKQFYSKDLIKMDYKQAIHIRFETMSKIYFKNS